MGRAASATPATMSRNRQVATDLQAVALRVVGALRQAALPREVGDLRAADLRVEDLRAADLRAAGAPLGVALRGVGLQAAGGLQVGLLRADHHRAGAVAQGSLRAVTGRHPAVTAPRRGIPLARPGTRPRDMGAALRADVQPSRLATRSRSRGNG